MTGATSCTTYAFMPNQLAYCGPENRDLLEYGATKTVDAGLTNILSDFQNLWPYLRFIAFNNNIKDPFDNRVVEAYWVGNELLNNISIKGFHKHLIDTLKLKEKIDPASLEYLIGKIPQGAKPHHTFHVMNVFAKTNHWALGNVLETINNCRVSWGKITNVEKDFITVTTQPIVMQDKKMKLGQPIIKKVQRSVEDKTFIGQAELGDWLSFHWNFACEIITLRQALNLKLYTEEAITLANLTI
ncbi:hypothetical protein KKG41_01900 [Patescibacteria group bacterium]|nr:hypothetical protein [Patescibacteria group bacterium]MBU1890402.1 hypothetical protein [Patescibacteria group bacterium]